MRLLKHGLLLSALFITQLAVAAPLLIPDPPAIAAKSYIMIDANSGKVLVQNNADERLDPASLTKLMTSYVADYELREGNINLDDSVQITTNAWAQNFPGSSVMFLEPGTEVELEKLLKGIAISSGNDATVALAEHVAGSEKAFVDLMNQHAALLGLENTRFANPHGLTHSDHFTSARDMALLAQAIIREFPEEYAIYAEKEFTYNGIRQSNRNRLLWRDPSVDGLKTGHTESAGFCLVSSAVRDDMRLIVVVMGTRSDEARFQETQKLLSYGFRYYTTRKLYDKGQVVNQARVWGGVADQVPLMVTDTVYVTLPKSQADELTAEIAVDKYIEAAVEKGQVLGEMVVKAGDQTFLKKPVVAQTSVESGGIFAMLWSKIKLFFVKLLDR